MKFISINRTYNGDVSKSTLVIDKNSLVVIGNLPHNASITFDEENALKLYKWLRDTYEIKENP